MFEVGDLVTLQDNDHVANTQPPLFVPEPEQAAMVI